MTHPKRILYIEDNAGMAQIVIRGLTNRGYEVTHFAHGLAALHTFEKNPQGFDAVLTDLNLPGIINEDLIHELRASRPTLPITVITGEVKKPTEELLSAGATHVIRKPCTMDRIVECLQTATHMETIYEENSVTKD